MNIPSTAKRDPAFGNHHTLYVGVGTPAGSISYVVIFDTEFDMYNVVCMQDDEEFEQFRTIEELNEFLSTKNIERIGA